MRLYSSSHYRGVSRRRRLGRILLLLLLTAAILISFLVMGNILHDRLEDAAPLLSLPIISYTDSPAASSADTAVPFHIFVAGDTPDGIFCTMDTAVLREGDPEAVRAACAVAAELYDGLSVTVRGEDGLRFAPEGTETGDETLPGAASLRTLCDAAGEYGLILCAVWHLPGGVPEADSDACDGARELAKMGFDEILFTGLTAGPLREQDISAMTALSSAVKEGSPALRVGFALEDDVFADVDSAYALETLAMSVDLLAVDFGIPPEDGTDEAEYARDCAGALYGSIEYYPLRVLIRGSVAAVAAQSAALQELGCAAVQPVT